MVLETPVGGPTLTLTAQVDDLVKNIRKRKKERERKKDTKKERERERMREREREREREIWTEREWKGDSFLKRKHLKAMKKYHEA